MRVQLFAASRRRIAELRAAAVTSVSAKWANLAATRRRSAAASTAVLAAPRKPLLRRALVGVTALALVLPLADGADLLLPTTPAVAAAGDVQLKTQLVTTTGEVVADTSGCNALPGYVSLGTVTFAGNVPDQGSCSFERAYYKSGDNLLELTGIKVDGDKLVLVPKVSAAEAASQRYVELSLAVPANRVFDNIILQFINNKDAIRVSLDPQGAASSLLEVNGQKLTANRVFRANKVQGTNSYYFEVTASMPRERALNIQQFTESSNDAATGNKFRVVEDTSTPDVTTRRYGFTVTNPGNVNTVQHALMNLGTSVKQVPLFGWMGQSHVYASTNNSYLMASSESVPNILVYANSDSCGGGTNQCSAQSQENWAADWVRDETGKSDAQANKVLGSHPFFFSVLSTAAGTAGKYDLKTDGSRDLTYFGRRFGFDGPGIADGDKIPSDKYIYWSGWDNWYSGYPKYNKSTTPTLSDLDNNNAAQWGTTYTPVFKAQNWLPQKVNVQQQSFGSANKVEFYAQYSGASPAMVGLHGGNYPKNNSDGYSWFLDRVRLNGEWYPVPFPKLEAKDVQVDGSIDTSKSENARSNMLGSKVSASSLPFPIEDSVNTDAEGMGICGTAYKPRKYAEYKISNGVNAGTTLRVELVNARVMGDYRADGWSGSWNTGTGGRKIFTRQRRNSYVWWNGAAMQMLDNSACSGAPSGNNRNVLMNNQWKSLYRITIEGMSADKYDVGIAWGITSQGFFGNAGGSVLDDGEKISVARSETPDTWTQLNPLPKTGDGSNPDRLTRSQIKLTGDNVSFKLKDGYINPRLVVTTAYPDNVGDPSLDASAYTLANGKLHTVANTERSFAASAELPRDVTSRVANTYNIGLSRSGYFSVEADEVQLPVIYLQNTVAEGAKISEDTARKITTYRTSTKPVVADSDTVPEQWSGTNLTPNKISKGAYAWQLVKGKTPLNPDPASSAAFIGYRVYGVKFNPAASTNFDDAVAKTKAGTVPAAIIRSDEVPLLSPEDVLNLSNTQIRLSNDAATDRRFDAVWLAPEFSTTVSGKRITYTAENFNIKSNQSLGSAFSFVGAPGLTATVTRDYDPPAKLTRNNTQLEYVNTAPEKAELGTNIASGIRFNYQPEQLPVVFNKKWVVNGTEYANGAQPQQLQASFKVNDTSEEWGKPTTSTVAGVDTTFLEKTSFDPKFKGCTLDDAKLLEKTTGQTIHIDKQQQSDGSWTAAGVIPALSSVTANSTVTDNVAVKYSFVSSDAQRLLPAEVKALLNPGGTWPATAAYGTTVAAPNLSKVMVESTDNNGVEGTWLFSGWDQTAKSARSDLTFTGTWEFVPTRNLRAVTYDYAWAPESGLTDRATLPWAVLPTLPGNTYIGRDDPLPGAPARPAPGATVSDASRGTFTFKGWRQTDSGYVGEWNPPALSNVHYAVQFVDTTGATITGPGTSTKAYKWVTGTAPETQPVPNGITYTMPQPKSVAVTIRNQANTIDPADAAPFTADWNDWGTFIFKGYDYATQTADGSDLTFTAKWEWRPREWYYAVGVQHVSTTDGVTPSPQVLAAMQHKFAPSNLQVKDGSGWTSPLGGPDITVPDTTLGGTWKLLATEPASYTATGLTSQLDPAGAKRTDNGQTITIGQQRTVDGDNVRHYAPVTAKWEFTPNSTPGAEYIPAYRFEDADNASTQLPAEVTELLTGLPAPSVRAGDTFLAPELRRYVVDDPSNNRYYWLFNGWDAPYKVSGPSFTFVGKWSKTAKVPGKRVSGYMWAWEDGTNAGLPANELPALPAFKLVDTDTQTPDYPEGLSANQVFNTSAGKLTLVASDVGSGDSAGIRTLKLRKPATHSISYDFDVVDANGQTLLTNGSGGQTALATALGSAPSGMEAGMGTLAERLRASLPAGKSGVAEGQAIRPAAIVNTVVDVRGESWNYNNKWGSFRFVGWKANSASTMGTSDVKYVAKFEWIEGHWWRGVQVKQRSTTTKFGSTTEKLTIPADVQAAMQDLLGPGALSVEQGSGATWTVPNLAGKKVADPSNNGTWRFKGFKWVQNALGGTSEKDVAAGDKITVRTSGDNPTLTEFPRVGTDDSTWLKPYGAGAANVGGLPAKGNRNLQMVAEWELESSPIFEVTNTVTCNSQLQVKKAIGEIKDGVQGVSDTAAPEDFEVRMTDPAIAEDPGRSVEAGTYYWGWSGQMTIPGANVTYKAKRQEIVNKLRKIDVLEKVPTASGKPTKPEYVFDGWECASGELGDVDEKTTRATVHYGLGQNVECTVKNTAAQLTILPVVLQDGQFKALEDNAPELTATPDAAGKDLGLTTKIKTSLDAASSVNNTMLVRPRAKYTVSAGKSGLSSVLRYERYTGTNPNDPNIMSSTSWETVSTAAPETALEPGTHAVYRAVYTPYTWRPELPLTGGLASDWFLILGGIALLAGVLGAAVHRERRRRAEEAAL